MFSRKAKSLWEDGRISRNEKKFSIEVGVNCENWGEGIDERRPRGH